MPERRGSRFVVEALFLAGLAVALALAKLDAVEIVGAMALGWLAIAAIEWIAWRGEPHYGSGLPPRYHLPRVELPPPQPLEQVGQGYPGGGRDDAPTWIASASLRASVLGEWPVSGPPPAEDVEREPVFVTPAEAPDPWMAMDLPPTPDDRQLVSPPGEPVIRPSSRPRGTTSWFTVDPLGDPMPKRRPRHDDAAGRWIRVPTFPPLVSLPSTLEQSRSATSTHLNG